MWVLAHWQYPKTQKIQKNAIYQDKTQHNTTLTVSKHTEGSKGRYLLRQNTTQHNIDSIQTHKRFKRTLFIKTKHNTTLTVSVEDGEHACMGSGYLCHTYYWHKPGVWTKINGSKMTMSEIQKSKWWYDWNVQNILFMTIKLFVPCSYWINLSEQEDIA